MEVKTLAKVEVSVLSILEKIKDNGGQTAVFTQKLVPHGDLSFQVSAMSDGNHEPDQEEHTEDTEQEAMVKVNILNLRGDNMYFYNSRWGEKRPYIRRFTTTMAILSSALSSISPPSVRTVETSFGACLEIRDTGVRYH